ncbi:hypothetical protein UFOVP780_18 [uncultured Caudovirales phage]|uniref:Uncharacterized protein n=1 Tax=uncultured Caudovirales phage TaxID=2100421 RepID=A0A6J5NX55_9CAUD|nr:hypothetical protein UFOVP780_18 [uncultured Caudovirales phage]
MKQIKFRTIYLSAFAESIDFAQLSNYNINEVYMIYIESKDVQILNQLNTRFPKYCKSDFQMKASDKGFIRFEFNCFPNKATGLVNETMMKRRNKVIEIIQSI